MWILLPGKQALKMPANTQQDPFLSSHFSSFHHTAKWARQRRCWLIGQTGWEVSVSETSPLHVAGENGHAGTFSTLSLNFYITWKFFVLSHHSTCSEEFQTQSNRWPFCGTQQPLSRLWNICTSLGTGSKRSRINPTRAWFLCYKGHSDLGEAQFSSK